MNAATVVARRRELAHRVGAGLEVTLYWTPIDDRTSIEIRHVASNTTVRFAVPADRALDAFYHPLAHLVPETSSRVRR
jgi:hypothetical protein